MVRAVLFDLGDTLLDFEPMDTRALFREAAEHAYAYLQDKQVALPDLESYFRAQYRALRWSYLWAKLRRREFNSSRLLSSFCRRCGFEPQPQELEELAWLWYRPLVDHSSVADDVITTLTALRDAGLKLGVVSNTFVAGHTVDRHLSIVGLIGFFPVRIYSSEAGHRKPHPRIFKLALTQLGTTAHETVFVGDVIKSDIVGAARVGMTTVWRCPWSRSDPRGLADHTIRRISELPALLGIRAAANAAQHTPS